MLPAAGCGGFAVVFASLDGTSFTGANLPNCPPGRTVFLSCSSFPPRVFFFFFLLNLHDVLFEFIY